MSGTVTSLDIILRAKDAASKVFGQTEGGLKRLSGANKEVSKSTEENSRSNEKLRGTLTKAGIAITAVGAGLTAFAKSAIDKTAEFTRSVIKMSRETGVGTEQASRLMYAANRMGLSADQASTAFGIFSKRINESSESTRDLAIKQQDLRAKIAVTQANIRETTDSIRENGDASGDLSRKVAVLRARLEQQRKSLEDSISPFDQLGVSIKNADGTTKSFDKILLEVSDKFKDMPDGAKKTALAMELFGRSGKDLLPILNQGKDGITQLMKQADKLGITLSAENINKVKDYTKAQKDLADAQFAVKLAIGQQAIPALTDLNKKIAEGVTWLLQLPEPFRSAAAGAAAFGGPVLTAAGGLLTFVANIATALPMLSKLRTALALVAAGGVITITLAIAGALVINQINQLKGDVDSLRNSVKGGEDQVAKLNARIAQMAPGPERDRLIKLRNEMAASNEQARKAADYYGSAGGVIGTFGQDVLTMAAKIPLAIPILQHFNNTILGFALNVAKIGNAFGIVPDKAVKALQLMRQGMNMQFAAAKIEAEQGSKNVTTTVGTYLHQLPPTAKRAIAKLPPNIREVLERTKAGSAQEARALVARYAREMGLLPPAAERNLRPVRKKTSDVLEMAGIGREKGRGAIDAFVKGVNSRGGRITGPTVTIPLTPSGQLDIRAILERSSGGVVPGYAKGGRVSYLAGGGMPLFSPRGTDTVPAMLTPGEYVMTSRQQSNLGSVVDFLDSLRNGTPDVRAEAGPGQQVTMVMHNHFNFDLSNADLRAKAVEYIRMVAREARARGVSVETLTAQTA